MREIVVSSGTKYDANIAYRYSCRAGQCGSCAIKVNGKAKLACKAEIGDNDILEPLDLPVIKDLIVDRSELNNKIKNLNIRTGPSTKYPRTQYIKPGVYTIVEEQDGWGKLKSGAGWISLAYTEKE